MEMYWSTNLTVRTRRGRGRGGERDGRREMEGEGEGWREKDGGMEGWKEGERRR